MLSERYEFKFLITNDEKRRILEAARPALEEDAHGHKAVYRVSSQYFDTSDLAAYWEKVDGQRVRKKFRLRYYTIDGSSDSPVRNAFMEIKHRINHTVYKERVRLTDEGALAILTDASELRRLDELVADGEETKRSTLSTIMRDASHPEFMAVNVITYVREAWEGRIDQRLRVTFDSSCRVLGPSEFMDVATWRGHGIVPGDRTVMEIKFDRAIPRWIRDVTTEAGVRLQRFSKYGAGVEVLGLRRAGSAAAADDPPTRD